MASTTIIKRRVVSIRNTRQITRAMEMVSASKLRQAQAYASASHDYSDLANHILTKLNAMREVNSSQPLFKKRPIKQRLYIVVTSNTGLVGVYNNNILKLLTNELRFDQTNKIKSHVITIGSKAAQFVRRLSHVDLMATYPPFGDHPSANHMRPILNMIISQYELEAVDSVQILYTKFQSTLIQQAQVQSILPVSLQSDDQSLSLISEFEPDIKTVIEQVTTRLIEAQIWQAILESLASEHAMRMMVTRNATDNADDLIEDYTLELNTARQADITQQLAEISSGAEALAK